MTRNDYEEILNEQLGQESLETLREDFAYLSSNRVVLKNALNKTMGTLLRRKDPIKFETGFNEAKREDQ